MARRGQHLALVPPPDRRTLRAPAARIALRGAPWRPGELPGALAIELSVEAAAAANAHAREGRVPVELWLRATIDGARVLEELAAPGEDAAFARRLDCSADRELARLGPGGALAEYALALVRGEPGSFSAVRRGGGVELCLPADLELAWRLAASARGQDLASWAASLARAPLGAPLRWEAAAAARGQRLAEWCYAVRLRASCVASAWPQART
jgi:hypothetical protein